MLIHYRHEGGNRTICGQRWHPGHRPRVLRREWTVFPPARAATAEEIGSRVRFPCSECMSTAASQIGASRERANRPKPWVGRFEQQADDFKPEVDS